MTIICKAIYQGTVKSVKNEVKYACRRNLWTLETDKLRLQIIICTYTAEKKNSKFLEKTHIVYQLICPEGDSLQK